MSHAQIRISKMGDALYCNVHFAFDQISFEMNVLMGCAPTQIMLVFFFFFFWFDAAKFRCVPSS